MYFLPERDIDVESIPQIVHGFCFNSVFLQLFIFFLFTELLFWIWRIVFSTDGMCEKNYVTECDTSDIGLDPVGKCITVNIYRKYFYRASIEKFNNEKSTFILIWIIISSSESKFQSDHLLLQVSSTKVHFRLSLNYCATPCSLFLLQHFRVVKRSWSVEIQ